eukprot:g6386.t1
MSSTKREPKVDVNRDTQFVTISPADGEKHSASVIFLHGLGDTSFGWAGAMHQFACDDNMSHIKFILPTAPVQPVTLNMGASMPSWYDLKGLGDRAKETCDGIDASKATVAGLIDNEVKSGISPDRIMVGGFSQGGALTLYTSLTSKYTLAGAICMSGYLPKQPPNLECSEEGKKTPFIMCHGEADPMVQMKWATASHDILTTTLGVNVEWHSYPGLQHSANDEELEDVSKFIQKCVPKVVSGL